MKIPKNLKYENSLWSSGLKIIAGVDEVGRGSLAGPLVAAAVVWPIDILDWIGEKSHPHYEFLTKIKDSKKVTSKNREILSEFIKQNCAEYSIAEISSTQIDEYGVGICNIQALEYAALQIKNADYILVDHHKIFTKKVFPGTTSITEGESHSISIAAASIIAKVYRDKLMKEKYHAIYPNYGFDKHVGYGTKKHIEAIKIFDLSDIHRRSFCKKFLKN